MHAVAACGTFASTELLKEPELESGNVAIFCPYEGRALQEKMPSICRSRVLSMTGGGGKATHIL